MTILEALIQQIEINFNRQKNDINKKGAASLFPAPDNCLALYLIRTFSLIMPSGVSSIIKYIPFASPVAFISILLFPF